jgi:uncharacterized protein (DUF2252 family)
MEHIFESRDDQIAAGRAARRAVPRSSAADWRPSADRPDPMVVLLAQDRTRVAGLVPVRHARMGVSPFTFYRGAAAIMADDLATLATSGLEVQLCGDAHLSNLGVFASPSRELLFDLNDFDETLRGPWEWDLHRLATSFAVAAQDRAFTKGTTRRVVRTVAATYRAAMADLAYRAPLELWYARLDTSVVRSSLEGGSKAALRQIDKGVAAAQRRTSLQAARKLTEVVDGRLAFRSDPPVLVPLAEVTDEVGADRLADAIRSTFEEYVRTLPDATAFLLGRYRLVDIAHKVVGVGSVGMRAFVVLLESDAGDPLILQFKEAGPSVLESHLGTSPYRHHGERVVQGQHMMQAASDIFLGWSTSVLDSRHYYWRQLRDMKGSAVVEEMTEKALGYYAQMCGWSLARAHARSGPAAAIAAYLGKGDAFDEAAVSFALRYSSINAVDFARHAEAIDTGEVPCEGSP